MNRNRFLQTISVTNSQTKWCGVWFRLLLCLEIEFSVLLAVCPNVGKSNAPCRGSVDGVLLVCLARCSASCSRGSSLLLGTSLTQGSALAACRSFGWIFVICVMVPGAFGWVF